MSLILPPGYNSAVNGSVAVTRDRARFWHDYQFPGDIARAIVVAQKEGRPGPKMPENCPNRDCKVCHPTRDETGRVSL
jgi:hypothetical protein